MASTSSVPKSYRYDVFLSFRGEDTRKTFVDHLYHALVNKGIITYKDDEKINKGEIIKEQLIRSIQDSRFYIIVFSKNYASSSWCLNELAEIMKCQEMTGHTAYPIFFDVEPTEVRNQSGAVGEAFAKHVKGRWSSVLSLDCLCSSATIDLENEDNVGRWRNAMKEAAGLAGMELNTFNGHEAKFIQQIVEEVSLKLHFFNPIVDGKLVGMKTRVKDVISSLEIDSDDVRMIGIWGMGGGGKTTLARAVFDYISIHFEGRSFVENVREVSQGSGLKELQGHVLSTVLNDQTIVVPSVSDGKNMIKKMLGNGKILLVLDDVDDIGQLEALAGEPTWFKTGSRIIITTRDEQVLKAHQVNYIHDVCLLSDEEAICLFSRYAFGREIPNHGYEKLSRMVVHYAAGLPLTIKVLGSFLYDRVEGEWKDTIERLKTIPLKETLEKLELSYNGLENDQKGIFLDIACILKGEKKKKAIRILESHGFHAQIGLRVLVQKSLITISKVKHYDGEDVELLFMHDHLEEMGRNIVRRLHPDEPSRHSRLWIKEEIEDILVNELGTEETKCIKLGYTHLNPAIIMKGLGKMKELRWLYVGEVYGIEKVDEVSNYLPDGLQSLYWCKYPFCCLPKTFRANKLVNLEMAWSKITELWEGGERKVLNKLKFVDLSASYLRTFDLTMTPLLEHLVLRECYAFVELQMPVECPNLKILDLSLSRVSNLNLGMTPNLEHLDLRKCSNFVELQIPVGCRNLKILDLSHSKVSNLNLGMTPHLEKLTLRQCADFVELHMPVECPNLKILILHVTKVGNLNLGMTPNLEKLDLDACNEFEIHMPIECPKLIDVKIRGSKVSNLNLELTPNLEKLELSECHCLLKIHAPVGCLKKLVYFRLDTHSNFESFEVDEQRISAKLYCVATSYIKARCIRKCPLHCNNKLPNFEFRCETDEPGSSWMGNLEKLIYSSLCPCKYLENWSATIGGLQHLRGLSLEGSIPGDLWQFGSLETLSLSWLEIQHLPDSVCMLKHLKSLEIIGCWIIEQLPEDICRLRCLEKLTLRNCTSLRDIPSSICKMTCLKYINLTGCYQVEKLPEELGCLECLEKLDLGGCTSLQGIPNSICKMKCLKCLNLFNCCQVENLPEELGCLECLEKLDLVWCTSLQGIPNSICKMKCLKCLDLSNCRQVKNLPEELGCLECLKELEIHGAGISRLPQSIFQLKGLRITGSREQLESGGFKSFTKTTSRLANSTLKYRDFYYVEIGTHNIEEEPVICSDSEEGATDDEDNNTEFVESVDKIIRTTIEQTGPSKIVYNGLAKRLSRKP